MNLRSCSAISIHRAPRNFWYACAAWGKLTGALFHSPTKRPLPGPRYSKEPIMTAIRTTSLAAVTLAIGILLGTGLITAPPAVSYADPVAGPMPPQYMTATIDANELEAKIGDLARENWEIISIT